MQMGSTSASKRDPPGSVEYPLVDGVGGQIVGIEVKATATLDRKDFRGLDDLAQATGQRFHRGILLYSGSEVIPFERSLHALPISALWYVGSEQVPE